MRERKDLPRPVRDAQFSRERSTDEGGDDGTGASFESFRTFAKPREKCLVPVSIMGGQCHSPLFSAWYHYTIKRHGGIARALHDRKSDKGAPNGSRRQKRPAEGFRSDERRGGLERGRASRPACGARRNRRHHEAGGGRVLDRLGGSDMRETRHRPLELRSEGRVQTLGTGTFQRGLREGADAQSLCALQPEDQVRSAPRRSRPALRERRLSGRQRALRENRSNGRRGLTFQRRRALPRSELFSLHAAADLPATSFSADRRIHERPDP